MTLDKIKNDAAYLIQRGAPYTKEELAKPRTNPQNMKKYKLTTQELTTYNGFKWEIGKKYTTSGEGELCGPGFLHYYHHPLLAVLLNPVHADLTNPKLFEVEARGTHLDDNGLKGGCTEMTLIKEIDLPQITTTQRVAFALLVSLDVYNDKGYKEWAEKWLSGADRSESAARSTESAARSTESAAWFAARSAESADLAKLIECAEKCLEY